MTKKPSISIIIPTYNREEVLVDTIKNVLSLKGDFELLVIDQTTRHNRTTEDYLRTHKVNKKIRYFRVSPPSLTLARNFAIKKARADIVCFIDDDVILSQNFIREHVNTHRQKPDVAVVAGRVEQDGFPTSGAILKFNELGISEGVFSTGEDGYTNSFPGGNNSIKKHIFKHAGTFDTNFHKNAFREESEFANRIVKSGYKIYYNHKASLLHLRAPYGGCRTPQKDQQDNPDFYANELYFTIKTVRLSMLPKALFVKFRSYCIVGKKKTVYRWALFLYGLLTAIKRSFFRSQLTAKEVSK